MRGGPGPDYPVLGVVLRDEQYAVVGRNNRGDWWQVCCAADGEAGWLFGELVAVVGDGAAVPIVEVPLPNSNQGSVTP